uniref:Uncharacterized protein n=1 Tax=Heterorhabditis bacteriophora TaxID=37862 RepID=A0A1I7W7S1_HETBA
MMNNIHVYLISKSTTNTLKPFHHFYFFIKLLKQARSNSSEKTNILIIHIFQITYRERIDNIL